MKAELFYRILACTGILFGITGLTRSLFSEGKDKPTADAPADAVLPDKDPATPLQDSAPVLPASTAQ